MTTNGSLLAPRAAKLKELGLNRVNISLDSLDSDAFALCVGKANQLDSVLMVFKVLLLLVLLLLKSILFFHVTGLMMKFMIC